MANRYWVGGSGNIDDYTHWSNISGGAGGFSVPSSTDDVFFDVNSFSAGSRTISSNRKNLVCQNISFIGVLYSPILYSSVSGYQFSISVYGNMIMDSTVSFYAQSSNTYAVLFVGSGIQHLTTNGCVMPSIQVNCTGTVMLEDNIQFIETAYNYSGWLTIIQGTFDTNGYNITIGQDYYISIGTSAQLKTIYLRNSIIRCGYMYLGSNLTLDGGTSQVTITGSTGSYPHNADIGYNTNLENTVVFYDVTLLRTGMIDGYITFNNLILTPGKTYSFEPGKIVRLNGDLVSDGVYGSLITIKSKTDGSSYTILKPSGTVSVNFYSIRDCIATGGATFKAFTSTDVSGNTGWIFSKWIQVAPQYNSHIRVGSLVVWNNELYGVTTNNGGTLLKWNGSDTWTQVAPVKDGIVNMQELFIMNNKICCTTGNAYMDVNGGRLFQYDDVNHVWTSLATRYNSETWIFGRTFFNGELYAGSYPNCLLLKWNGSNAWTPVAPRFGTETYLFNLKVFDNTLYATTLPNNKLLRWSTGTNSWTEVTLAVGSVKPNELILFNNDLYTRGTYNSATWLCKWDGLNSFVPKVACNAMSTLEHSGKLYIGTSDTGRLMCYDPITNTIAELASQLNSQIYIMSLALFNNKIYGSTGEGGRLFQHTVLTAGKSLYIGSTQISNVYLGTINITGQYLGATLVS